MLIGINGGYFPAICRVCFFYESKKSIGFLVVFLIGITIFLSASFWIKAEVSKNAM